MAVLTISEKARGQVGGKAFRAFEITVASAITGNLTVTAASCDLSSFKHVMVQPATWAEPKAKDCFLSTVSGTYIDMIVSSVAVGDQFEMWAIGE